MSLDLGEMHGWVVDLLAERRPVADSMPELIGRCESARPHPDWARLRNLRFDDLASLADWLRRPFAIEPYVRPLLGLWFGLFNPCDEYGRVSADMYVSGSERFDPDPESNDWSVSPDWWPESRYAQSAVLANIYRIAYDEGDLGNDAEYPLCLGYAAFAVRELLSGVEPSLVLGRSPFIGVAVGFDSGDFVPLGGFGSMGWDEGKTARR